MHLGAAEARLDRVRDLQSDLEAQCVSFRAEIAPLRRLAADGLPGASEELGRLVDALYGIRAVQPPGTLAEPAAAPVAQTPATTSSPSAVEPAAYDGTGQPLPRGFVWVPIDEIRSRELLELPTRAEFRNIAYDEVVRGFETLRRSVLPAIRPGGGIDPSLEAGWGAADLAADPHNIFQGFFGSEQIHLSRRAGMKYGIVNGRHRIRVALDLGWTAIPASIDEVE
jgi:hypothetical protein